MAGLGGTVATWSIAEAADKDAGIGGMGVTQTSWSECGRYLYVVERKSGGVLVYDVRGAGKLLAWLEGRGAGTNQRLGVDVFSTEKGMEIWAGGVDGVVRVWEGVGMSEGALERSWEWKAHDGILFSVSIQVNSFELTSYPGPVTSTIVHSSGTVVATCSGQRSVPTFEGSESGSEDDSSDSEEDSDESERSSRSSSQRSFQKKCPDNSIKVWSL